MPQGGGGFRSQRPFQSKAFSFLTPGKPPLPWWVYSDLELVDPGGWTDRKWGTVATNTALSLPQSLI